MKMFGLFNFSLALVIATTSASASASPYRQKQKAVQNRHNLYLRGSGNLMTRELDVEECTDDADRSDICISIKGNSSYVAPTGNNGVIDIDGNDTEWDKSRCGVPMYEAGDPGKKNAIQHSQAWLDWNCTTNTLCILIKTLNDKEYVIVNDTEQWFKAYDEDLTSKISITEDWQYIYNDGGNITGVEGCYHIAQNTTCIEEAEIHVNVFAT